MSIIIIKSGFFLKNISNSYVTSKHFDQLHTFTYGVVVRDWIGFGFPRSAGSNPATFNFYTFLKNLKKFSYLSVELQFKIIKILDYQTTMELSSLVGEYF